MDLKNKIIEILKEKYLCDHCLGRIVGNLLSGYTNEERGRMLRTYIAMSIDMGEQLQVEQSNLYGIRFRNAKISAPQPEACFVCRNFFESELDGTVAKIAKRLEGLEYGTFLVGSSPSDEMLNAENHVWEKVGIEGVESLKSEMNREIGKRLEKATGRKFSLKTPDVTVHVDLKNSKISLNVRSLFIEGGYRKLVRGIPQTRWVCPDCGGKGCVRCKGRGTLYPTSIQQIIEAPLLKAADGKTSFFHGHGREDIDVRCFDWRPFVMEISKPARRSIDVKKAEKQINKNRKVNVKGLKLLLENGKEVVRKLKSDRYDKTYLAEVAFASKIDKRVLHELKKILDAPILQKTPRRVLHRRSDKFRKRSVKEMSWKVVGDKKMKIKVRTESGLYIKELINGDEGRTRPSVAELINNKVKKINLDVIKVHVTK